MSVDSLDTSAWQLNTSAQFPQPFMSPAHDLMPPRCTCSIPPPSGLSNWINMVWSCMSSFRASMCSIPRSGLLAVLSTLAHPLVLPSQPSDSTPSTFTSLSHLLSCTKGVWYCEHGRKLANESMQRMHTQDLLKDYPDLRDRDSTHYLSHTKSRLSLCKG